MHVPLIDRARSFGQTLAGLAVGTGLVVMWIAIGAVLLGLGFAVLRIAAWGFGL